MTFFHVMIITRIGVKYRANDYNFGPIYFYQNKMNLNFILFSISDMINLPMYNFNWRESFFITVQNEHGLISHLYRSGVNNPYP